MVTGEFLDVNEEGVRVAGLLKRGVAKVGFYRSDPSKKVIQLQLVAYVCIVDTPHFRPLSGVVPCPYGG